MGADLEPPEFPDSRGEDAPMCLDAGDCALIVTSDNEIALAIPKNGDQPVPDRALVLIAIAKKLDDPEWVERLMSEYWAEHEANAPPSHAELKTKP